MWQRGAHGRNRCLSLIRNQTFRCLPTRAGQAYTHDLAPDSRAAMAEMAAEIETADPEGGGLTAAVATLPAMGFGTWKFLWHMPVCCDPAFCRFSKPCLKKFVARSG